MTFFLFNWHFLSGPV